MLPLPQAPHDSHLFNSWKMVLSIILLQLSFTQRAEYLLEVKTIRQYQKSTVPGMLPGSTVPCLVLLHLFCLKLQQGNGSQCKLGTKCTFSAHISAELQVICLLGLIRGRCQVYRPLLVLTAVSPVQLPPRALAKVCRCTSKEEGGTLQLAPVQGCPLCVFQLSATSSDICQRKRAW